MTNKILITHEVDGFKFIAQAIYLPSCDGWECRVWENKELREMRGPDETGNDAWDTLKDMIDLALHEARGREAMCDGPFSNAQSQR